MTRPSALLRAYQRTPTYRARRLREITTWTFTMALLLTALVLGVELAVAWGRI